MSRQNSTPEQQSFSDYYRSLSPRQKKALAARARTAVSYLNTISQGRRNAGRDLIDRLMQADPNIRFSMFRASAS